MTAPDAPETVVRVEAYAGARYPERPLRVYWQGEVRAVMEVEHQWQEPQRRCFRVTLEGDIRLLLCYHSRQDVWFARQIEGA